MRRSPAFVLVTVLVTVVAGHLLTRVVDQPPAAASTSITPAVRAGGLRFTADVTAADRVWIGEAIATARPEAQRLIAEVDGAVTVTAVASAPAAAMGMAESDGGGNYRIWLNVAALDGRRKVDRPTVVLHELGHVVDYALIDD